MILKVRSGKVIGVVYVEAFAIVRHGVTREAKGGGFGAGHFARNTHYGAEHGQEKEYQERQYFPATRGRNAGPRHDHGDNRRGEENQNDNWAGE
jgi:hypothetical protein